jgi:hypothetical protein
LALVAGGLVGLGSQRLDLDGHGYQVGVEGLFEQALLFGVVG